MSSGIVNQSRWTVHVVFDEESITSILADDELAAVITTGEESSWSALKWGLGGNLITWEPIRNPDTTKPVAHIFVSNWWFLVRKEGLDFIVNSFRKRGGWNNLLWLGHSTGWNIFNVITSMSSGIVNQSRWTVHVVFDEESITSILADDELAAVITTGEESSWSALKWGLGGNLITWEPIRNPDTAKPVAHIFVSNWWLIVRK